MSSLTALHPQTRPSKRARPKAGTTDAIPEVAGVASEALARRIQTHQAQVAIVGQGYVGLPLATEFAGVGFPVSGLENDPSRVAGLNAGRSCTPDVKDDRLAALLEGG